MIHNSTITLWDTPSKRTFIARIRAILLIFAICAFTLFGLYSTLSASSNRSLTSTTKNTQPDSAREATYRPHKSEILLSNLLSENDIVTTTITVSISSSDNDAGIGSDCLESLDRVEIYFGRCGSTSMPITSGLRFENISLPNGATLADAYLRVRTDTVGPGTSRDIPKTRIYGEANANSPIFTTTNNDYPSARLNNTTTQYVLWDTYAEWTDTETLFYSPSLLTVTQEIMDTPGWINGNSITFLMTPDGCTTSLGFNACDDSTPNHQRIWAWNRTGGGITNSASIPHLILVYTETRKTDPTLSTFTISPNTAVADGLDFVTATVTLSDTNGILPNRVVDFSSTNPISVTWPNGNQTDANGQVIGRIHSLVPGVHTIYAEVPNEGVTLNQTHIVTYTEMPIAGLQANNNSPTMLGETTTLSATITSGNNVSYTWNFGDNSVGTGALATHLYDSAGLYTAIVTASNNTNFLTATTNITVSNPSADLSVSKTGSTDAVAGSSTVYEIGIANHGGQPATNVIVTDTLPVSTTFVAENSPYEYEIDANNGTIVWDVGVLQSGVTETFQLEVAIGSTVTGPITNTIVGSSGGEDGDLENNVREWGLTVSPPPPNADLAVQLSGPGSVPVGFPIKYVLTIQNVGGQMATGIVVTDTLPGELTFSDSTHPSYNTEIQNNDVIFAIGSLASGQSYQIALTGTVSSSAQAGSTITNYITGTIAEEETLNTGLNSRSLDTDIVAAASKITVLPPNNGASPAVYAVEQNEEAPATYVITLTNNGTADLVGGFNIVGKDYSWLSINPSVDTNDLEIGESVTINIAVTDTNQNIGIYRDLLIIEDENGTPLAPIFLQTYIHPDLVNIDTNVINTLSNSIPGALVSLRKEPDGRVFWVDGVEQVAPTLVYNQTTNGSGSTTFSGLEVGTYQYTISAPGHEPESGTIPFNSSSPFNPPALTALPGLVFEPNQAFFSVVAGESAHYTVQVRNEGPGHAENFTITTPMSLTWMSSALPYGITRLEAGEAMSVTLFLNPPESLGGSQYQDYITIDADDTSPGQLAAVIDVVADPVGSIDFNITNKSGIPISDANVVVMNENGRIAATSSGEQLVYDNASGTTDINGQVTLTDLPQGEYRYTIQAEGYYIESGTVTVVPDGSSGVGDSGQKPLTTSKLRFAVALNTGTNSGNQVNVQLTEDPFTYSWTVEEITITDTYAFTVEVTYEATAIEPHMFVSPAQFCPGDTVSFLVANMSPVTMTNVMLTPQHEGVYFGTSEVVIGELGPHEAYTGTLTTSGNAENAARTGAFHVTSRYTTIAGTFNYATRSQTRLTCPADNEIWVWEYVDDHPVGHYQGKSGAPGFPQSPPPASIPNGREVAQLTLSGDATLERQAFNAQLVLDSVSESSVEDITINIEAKDENGLAVVNGFAVTPTVPTLIGDLEPNNQLMQDWIIVPGNLGITNPAGVNYDLRAQIVYTYNSNVYTTTTIPQQITVYPQPYVRLEFSHTQPDDEGDFIIEVTAQNDGYGVAKNLSLDLSDVSTLPDLDGNQRNLIFVLKENTIEGITETQSLEYVFRFGNLEPGAKATGRWLIGVGATDGALLDDQMITGFKVSCTHLPYLGLELSAILNCGEIQQPYLTYDCPFCGMQDTTAQVGGPIATGNGNYTYRQSTPSIPTVGNSLQFEWTYNSLNTGIDPGLPVLSSTLGLGWTHNHQLFLDLSQQDGAHGYVTVRAPHGTPIYFNKVRDGFEPAPGVHATMQVGEPINGRSLYTITTGSQATFVFSDTGQLLQRMDAKGNSFEYLYDGNDQLERVQEPVSGRFLEFAYHPDGTLASVTDPISRTTEFGYDINGSLRTITDTRNRVWLYDYTLVNDEFYLLSRIEDPDGRLVEETGFDAYGRAVTQTFRGQDLSIAYFDDGRRVITHGGEQDTIHVYNRQGLLIGQADVNEELEIYELDANHNRTYSEDRNGYPTEYAKTEFGYTTAITDSLGYTMTLEYDDNNNWTQQVNQRGEVSLYDYDEFSNLITQTNHLSDTVTYTYNESGQQTSMTDENDVTTQFGFDEIGQMKVITDALGHTSHFEYDEIGRVITTTDTTGKMTVNTYDGGNNLIQVIDNVHPIITTQNYLDEYNIVTQYGYDGAGNQVSMTNTLGMVSLSLLDDAGRVVTQVVNYDGVTPYNALCTDFSDPDPENNICSLTSYDELGRAYATTDSLGRIDRTFFDEQGRVVGIVKNWSGAIVTVNDLSNCLTLPLNRDFDVCTLFGHDIVGNNTVITDTVGRMTRTFYDPMNRIEGMIMNWDGQTTWEQCLTLPRQRDDNVCMMFGYDEMGNTIIVTDTFGQMTRTFYDILGRTEATVSNWNPNTLSSPNDCVIDPNNTSEENICTLSEYDPVGNPTVSTNALGQRSLTVYDSLNRPYISVAGWDGTPIDSEADCQFPPAEPDTNLCMVTYYDPVTNRPYRSKDPLGGLSDIDFDSAGRVVTSTRYLDEQAVNSVSIYDALGRVMGQTNARSYTSLTQYDDLNRPEVSLSPGGVVMTQTYDALGRVVSSTNNLGQVMTLVYDDLDRVVQTIDAKENVTTIEYDVLGNQTAIIDANLVRTSYEYDDLNRLERVIENDTGGSPTHDSNIVTEYHYDALGNQLNVVNGRSYTTTAILYDDLYRPRVITDALGHTTETEYNALGLRLRLTDANGAVTRYEYDQLNRPITVTYEADNTQVIYTYNALGQPLLMQDSVGSTVYEYDELYRLITVTHPITGQIGYGYDLLGNRNSLTYPDGRVVTYTYSADNRLTQLKDWDEGLVDYEYDAIGRLITTTLPTGVTSINRYDVGNNLVELSHYDSENQLLARFEYEVDDVGNRQVVTETLLAPDTVQQVTAYLEQNGLLVLEAENGATTPGNDGHSWTAQTGLVGYDGDGYVRALPDNGQLLETNALNDSPSLAFQIQTTTPANYTVWIRGMAADAAGDSVHVGLDGAVPTTADRLTGWQPNQWDWSQMTMDDAPATLDLSSSGAYTLNVWMREGGVRLDKMLLITDTNYIPTGSGPSATPLQVITDSVVIGELSSHTISYEYDDLYRLTQADYTGGLTATFAYSYDSVGNMTAYTKTVDTETTQVSRIYDHANRMQVSTDNALGTSSYVYDNNGNLTLVVPPNGEQWQHYGFDQRNLMISHTLSMSGTNPQLVAEFVYDGGSNRVQQSDYSGSMPVTTTYINDIVGLTQVMVADDGSSQTYNLFGLDLIEQEEGEVMHTLLTDGLGSVRSELYGNDVVATTVYDPFGNVLDEQGNKRTVYGYTGEQFDSSTSQLYLRARYYNPKLHGFMGKDPWFGGIHNPKSMNGWSYVDNNPVNLIDLTGMFPDYCREKWDKVAYVRCVAEHYDIDTDQIKLERYRWFGTSGKDWEFNSVMNAIVEDGSGCFRGKIPYRAPGYLESLWANEVLFGLNGGLFESRGQEIVYDYATFERQRFFYDGHYITDSLGWSYGESVGLIRGFKSWGNITDDYSGETHVWSLGAGINYWAEISLSIGVSKFYSVSDRAIHGHTLNIGVIGIGFDPLIPVAEPSYSWIIYTPRGPTESYVMADGTVDVERLYQEALVEGNNSPWVLNSPAYVMKFLPEYNDLEEDFWGKTHSEMLKYSKVYEEMEVENRSIP